MSDEEKKTLNSNFAMQCNCGIVGLLLTILWALVMVLYENLSVSTSLNLRDILTTLFYIAIAFIIPLIVIIFYISLPDHDKPIATKKNTNVKLNLLIWFFSFYYLVCSCFLMLSSGGPGSPITVYFTMTYTLTILRVKTLTRQIIALFIYILGLSAVCLATYYYSDLGPNTPNFIMRKNVFLAFQNEALYFWSICVGVALSLVVSTFSPYISLIKKHTQEDYDSDKE